jgi:hypothetical protein
LRVLGNWNKLYKGIMAGVDTRSVYLCGKWYQLAKKLLLKADPSAALAGGLNLSALKGAKTNQMSGLNAVGRWGYLAEVMLKRQPIF